MDLIGDRIPGLRRLSRLQLGKLGALGDVPSVVKDLADVGILHPIRPDKLGRVLIALQRWGASPAAAIVVAAIERGDDEGLADEIGSLTFNELDERSNRLANALREDGVGPGDGVAIMCRNHRWFVDATLACAKLGASALYMNTGFAAPQFTGVVEREEPSALIYDDEFTELLSGALEAGGHDLNTYIGAHDSDQGKPDHQTIESLIESGDAGAPSVPDEPPRFIILTSGTTGLPKGAQRSAPDSLSPVATMLSKLGLHAREKTMIAAPLFHAWGFSHLQMALALASSTVVRNKFDPEKTLEALTDTGATVLVVVPVMMQRILDLPDETLDRYPLPDLEVTAVSGSALPGQLANDWMDRFGENVYNLYGSTEVAFATIASPSDLREAPGTAGRPPRGSIVKIYDEEGKELPAGESGRIFVGNEMKFEGYTGGGGKDEIDGLLSSGDVGHFDDEGRLFIDGRDDEMIVSGGENVFPREVEDLLADHEKIREAAVIGVDDEKFGQRLKAFVVTDGKLSEDEVRSYVKENLANYKVPREVEFLDELPRNSTGKVLKRELAEDGSDADGSD
jgi:acyl-CoA synthetase (AMP-forming)/AMP-acid ligase II